MPAPLLPQFSEYYGLMCSNWSTIQQAYNCFPWELRWPGFLQKEFLSAIFSAPPTIFVGLLKEIGWPSAKSGAFIFVRMNFKYNSLFLSDPWGSCPNWICKIMFQLDFQLKEEVGDTGTYVMNGEWALLGNTQKQSKITKNGPSDRLNS